MVVEVINLFSSERQATEFKQLVDKVRAQPKQALEQISRIELIDKEASLKASLEVVE